MATVQGAPFHDLAGDYTNNVICRSGQLHARKRAALRSGTFPGHITTLCPSVAQGQLEGIPLVVDTHDLLEPRST